MAWRLTLLAPISFFLTDLWEDSIGPHIQRCLVGEGLVSEVSGLGLREPEAAEQD